MDPREESVIPDQDVPDTDADETADDAVLDDGAGDPGSEETDSGSADDLGKLREDLENFKRQAEENERRFKGLQGSLQQSVESKRAVEAEKQALEAHVFQAQIAQLPEDQQRAAWHQYTAERQNAQQHETLSQRERALDQAARGILVKTFAATYGVPEEEIADINDPDVMERYAKKYATLQRTARKSERRSKGKDTFEGSARQSTPKPKKYASISDAATAFSKLPLPTE